MKSIQRQKTISEIKEKKIIAILRNVPLDKIEKTVEAIIAGGISIIEIAHNQKSENCIDDNATAIRMIKERFKGIVTLGSGTVMNKEQVDRAVEAGADFILSPNFKPEVVNRANERDVVVIPGALTPSEIVDAYECGADFIKLFPVDNLGLSYVKAIKGPLNYIPLIGVGGITTENFVDYLNCGMEGISVGSYLANDTLIKEDNYAEIERRARIFSERVLEAKSFK
ncbi:MAG: bifunctional 4-hydroxy-2-oxoglutarate aldolase/2-dehydro-3-deoxy-phosphogluconate aldolase [Clostridiaceae bacterium]